MSKLAPILKKLLQNGIEIRMFAENDTVWYDMNTNAKSHLHLAEVDGEIVYRARYDESGFIDSYSEVLYKVKQCMHGRNYNYISSAWAFLLEKEGVLKVHTNTKTEITYS